MGKVIRLPEARRKVATIISPLAVRALVARGWTYDEVTNMWASPAPVLDPKHKN